MSKQTSRQEPWECRVNRQGRRRRVEGPPDSPALPLSRPRVNRSTIWPFALIMPVQVTFFHWALPIWRRLPPGPQGFIKTAVEAGLEQRLSNSSPRIDRELRVVHEPVLWTYTNISHAGGKGCGPGIRFG